MIPERIPLIQTPTPLHPLPRLSADLGVDLWIKRDDLTGFAFGGNKGRKLEFLMAEAVASGAEVVVTCGSLQSNFVRQLAAACALFGIRCVAATMHLPYEPPAPAPPPRPESPWQHEGGNALLDELLGADVRLFPDGPWDELYAHAERLVADLRAEGLRTLLIPVGGSSPLGAYGFVAAGQELSDQLSATKLAPFDHIVFASSSGNTHTGLQYAFRGSPTQVRGIACDPEPEIVEDFMRLYAGLEAVTGEPRPCPKSEWRLDFRFVGEGYGIPSPAGAEATRMLARREGIFLDPVYTAKAFAGLLHLVREGSLSGRILFWHTGGLPALFARS